jgi:hypothetical protein
MDAEFLIAGPRDPVLADYATHCLAQGRQVAVVAAEDVCSKIAGQADQHTAAEFTAASFRKQHARDGLDAVVVFLNGCRSASDRAVLEEVAEVARAKRVKCVCVVSTFRVHLEDREAIRAEAWFLRQLRGVPARVVVFRPGHVLSRHSPLRTRLRRWWFAAPLLPARLKSCCVEAEELFAAIDRELATPIPARNRTYTLLGPNKSWQDRLLEQASPGLARAWTSFARVLLPVAVLRFIVGLCCSVVAGRGRQQRAWHVETLRPRSLKELLALYNPYNHQHVKIVGYNNGVVHFGQQHPDKTVVSTVSCNRLARVKGEEAEFDAGVTIRQAMDVLGASDRELYVLPNYSYVSVGTAYFIPIHGSASRYSTVAETIEQIMLYDPAQDRILTANRKDPAFGQYVYNLAAKVILLRLSLQTREKSRYYVRHLEVQNPSGRDILACFHDDGPANVEVRKAGGSAETVKVSQYYTDHAKGEGGALELPRDSLGKLWDRLEENPLTSVLFHGLIRRFAHHVELFLSEEEFVTFWETHRSLPIHKIQLRFIRRDGFPNSPFRDRNCVSADLFMLKKHRAAFDAYLKETLPAAKMNPGKHSR